MQHGTNSSQYYIIYFNFSKRVNLMLSVLNTHTHTHTNNDNSKWYRRKHWEVIDMFMAWMVVMVSWMYTHLQIHCNMHIKFIQLRKFRPRWRHR